MEILPLAGMLFSLLVVIIIAGSILMFPIMRRLGRLLELRLEERRKGGPAAAELEPLRELVAELEREVARLSERQAFTERLLEGGSAADGSAAEAAEGRPGRPVAGGSAADAARRGEG